MVTFIKVLILLLALFVIFYPLLPWKVKHRKFSTLSALKYEKPHFRMNAVFIIVAITELIFFILLFRLVEDAGDFLANLPVLGSFMSSIVDKLGSNVAFIAFAITVLIANVLMIYIYILLKAIVKRFLDGFVYSDEEREERRERRHRKRKGKEPEKEPKKEADDYAAIFSDEDEEKKKKIPLDTDNVPVLKHIRNADKDDKSSKKSAKAAKTAAVQKKREPNAVTKLFFEAPDCQYAKPWVRRMVNILQAFIYITEVFFFILLTLIFVSVLFPVPDVIYDFLIDFMRVQSWYVYPFLSVIILQELCNTFKTEERPEEQKDEELLSEQEQIEKNKMRLRGLASELKRYFDNDHKLRFYPGSEVKDTKFEYKFTNNQYRGALEYIKKKFNGKTGNKGQSYLECMDAMFNDEHVYFCASFYSEFGEYLIAYTYTRLLSGARMIFIVKDKDKRNAVKKYLLERLIKMTGNSLDVTWRVYTSEDRLDQADILVASPEDFKDNNIVENYPDFFEEVCNAVFIDADKVVSLESYLCPVLAIRLFKATSDRIRFVFLSTDLLRGFAASSLPKLFCVDKVLSFSSAQDSERVEYTLWNKESLKNRIYYKSGQKLMSLEGIIAEKAYHYNIDGIRVVTSSPIDHGEREILAEHNVEINEFFKDVPEINYMIYSDERCNLAAAIYACTRFKGRRNSVAQIISKPYLLRDYFMAKATRENFIKRSSFIQPRITEHAKKEKLSLLKIFCHASAEDGMSVNDFISEMKDTISLSRLRNDVPLCPFCQDSPQYADLNKTTLKDYAAYLIAALCDSPDTKIEDSIGNKAKDYYLIIDHADHDIYSLTKEKYITFKKSREVFEKVFACNERVVLRLNDCNIGYLNTFPTRVPLEYVVGQSIVYNNVEYEIEQISNDNKIIFLRRENVTYKNCLDTLFLRRYKIYYSEKIGQDGVLVNSKFDEESQNLLKEIRVSMQKVGFEGETYGFYNLMSNKQSLNFVQGVEGNPHLESEAVAQNRRILNDGRMLRVTLTTGMECTDGMRMLCSAVFNEFIKTMFPLAYRCIAIVPVLEKPLEFSNQKEAETITEKIESLYPYRSAIDDEFYDKTEQVNQCFNEMIEGFAAILKQLGEAEAAYDQERAARQAEHQSPAELEAFYRNSVKAMKDMLVNAVKPIKDAVARCVKGIGSNYKDQISKFYPKLNLTDELLLEKAEAIAPEIQDIINLDRKIADLRAEFKPEDIEFVTAVAVNYAHIMAARNDFVETNKNRMQFLFINDCSEDVGVFDWFYDKLASNLQELLINAYSYLYWLNARPDLSHYIYFGMNKLPDCYDLQGVCQLFASYNIIISDSGEENYETAAEYEDEENRRCSFCHKLMESGRYSFFDDEKTLYICADCMDTVGTEDRLHELHNEVKKYLENTYPDVTFGHANVVFSEENEPMSNLNEWYFRIDPDKRQIYVGFDLPEKNTKMAILLGMISFWQHDNDLMTEYSNAQLSFEELKYFRGHDDAERAEWIWNELDSVRRENVTEIDERIKQHSVVTGEDGEEIENTDDAYNSFSVMREIGDELRDLEEDVDYEDIEGEDYYDGLYDPNKTPRFWKRYLKNGLLDETDEDGTEDDSARDDDSDGESEDNSDGDVDDIDENDVDETDSDDTDDDIGDDVDDDDEEFSEGISELKANCCGCFVPLTPNCPPPSDDDDDFEFGDPTFEEEDEEEDEALEETDVDDDLDYPTFEDEPAEDVEEPVEQLEEVEEYSDDAEDVTEDNSEEESGEETSEEETFEETSEEEGEEETSDESDGDDNAFTDDVTDESEESEETDEDDDLSGELDDLTDDLDDSDGSDGSDDSDELDELDDIDLEDEPVISDKDKKAEKKKKDQAAKKAEKDRKNKERQLRKIQKRKTGLDMVPYETEEETNPSIRIYNEMVRHAYNFDEEAFSREGVDDKRLHQIYTCVSGDYPELFWLSGYRFTGQSVQLNYRCRKPSGELDILQINKKLSEIRKGVKFFTHGISKKTDPYLALVTIYKRLILTLDYDSKGLDERIDADLTKDDRLRSLHSALVRRKTVCAGYAVAMQYLLQSVGILCANVVSEVKGNSCHAFNIVKIGKYCYYLDATWGDRSNTKGGSEFSDVVDFEYCCVPYNEFIKAHASSVHNHIPNHEYYPWFKKELKANRHEYYRYRKSYISRFNEESLVRVFAYCAEHYNEKEDGRFTVSFRCTGLELANEIKEKLRNASTYNRIVAKAKKLLAKNKRAAKLLDRQVEYFSIGYAPVVKILYKKKSK